MEDSGTVLQSAGEDGPTAKDAQQGCCNDLHVWSENESTFYLEAPVLSACCIKRTLDCLHDGCNLSHTPYSSLPVTTPELRDGAIAVRSRGSVLPQTPVAAYNPTSS